MKIKKSLFILFIFLFTGFYINGQTYYSISPSSKKSREDKQAVVIIKTNVVNASVYINGKYCGSSDLTITDLSEGYYRLRIEKNGYETAYVRIRAVKGYTYSYYVSLEKIVGYIAVSGIHNNSIVYIDESKQYGTGEWTVSTGYHTVKIREFGYYDYEETVYVQKKRVTVVNPVYKSCPFEISDFEVSKKIINPEYSNGFGRTEISFEVSNTGKALVYAADSFDNIVWYTSYDSFDTWEQSCTWPGTNLDGIPLPDGDYTIVLTDDENYYETEIVTLDRSVNIPLVNYTKSGSGTGTLPGAYNFNQSFYSVFAYVYPEFTISLAGAGFYETGLGGGFYADFAKCVELGFSAEGFIGLKNEEAPFSLNASFKYTYSKELEPLNYFNVSGLLRYGYSGTSRYADYGFDCGNGLGAGVVIGREFNRFYFGLSSEYVLSAAQGILTQRDDVWKNGLTLNYKPVKTVLLGGWTALNSLVCYKNELKEVQQPQWLRAVEAGLEVSVMPGSSSMLLDLKLSGVFVKNEDPLLNAKFGLSYLF